VLEAQLAVLTGSGSLEQMLASVTAATDQLAAAGDGVGEAKGHHIKAAVQAQLGQVADVESSLDRALIAARTAEDRRRITAVLAAAPRAALWGPSSVVRASGRCLDVVRILRMTPGNRHVEAIALRCQAVLEAMRGRPDAAREILAAGRTTLEELGLTLELDELAMHAGIVELLAGQPAEATELLRVARDGFAALGVSVSAGQSAALLGRALVEQGRADEALAEADYAEEHAGGDLKTAIILLGVRAEALARGGDVDQPVELARRAAELAGPTDALADKADANMVLARVLMAAGEVDEARAVASAARELYDQKDHVVGARRASELAEGPPPSTPEPTAAPPAGVLGDHPPERLWSEFKRRFDAHDLDGMLELYSEYWPLTDHRQLAYEPATGRGAVVGLFGPAFESSPDLRVDVEAVLAADERVIAVRGVYRGTSSDGGGRFELPFVVVTVVEGGLIQSTEIYAHEEQEAALARFEELRGRSASALGHSRPGA